MFRTDNIRNHNFGRSEKQKVENHGTCLAKVETNRRCSPSALLIPGTNSSGKIVSRYHLKLGFDRDALRPEMLPKSPCASIIIQIQIFSNSNFGAKPQSHHLVVGPLVVVRLVLVQPHLGEANGVALQHVHARPETRQFEKFPQRFTFENRHFYGVFSRALHLKVEHSQSYSIL